ncbi:hypothetical protein DID88_004041 [Monilinia fructigena]|uniref:Uncharacterized protein n=1 Tax=Monilinia fructigena TaxID=38457 RepID=A0A395IRN5_9HELO|nr:hypothetical protein DID88_004041 [Monilinia fructigena]
MTIGDAASTSKGVGLDGEQRGICTDSTSRRRQSISEVIDASARHPVFAPLDLITSINDAIPEPPFPFNPWELPKLDKVPDKHGKLNKGKEAERGRTLERGPRYPDPLEKAESRSKRNKMTIEVDGRPIRTRNRSHTLHDDPNDPCAIFDDQLLEPLRDAPLQDSFSEVLSGHQSPASLNGSLDARELKGRLRSKKSLGGSSRGSTIGSTDTTPAGTIFTVSSCGRFLMAANGCLIYVYELNKSHRDVDNWHDVQPGSLRQLLVSYAHTEFWLAVWIRLHRVAICPQRRCVAFGCSAGIELHWVDALTGQDLNRWFPLTAPSDFLFFLPPRKSIDSAKKLRLISSAAKPSECAAVHERAYGKKNARCFHFGKELGGVEAKGINSEEIEHAQQILAPVGRFRSESGRRVDHSDHYRAVPLSDGYHILFTDPGTGALCMGSDAPVGGPTKLLRKVWFQGPEGGGSPTVYAGGSDLSWGVRVVAAYGRGTEQSIIIWAFSMDGVAKIWRLDDGQHKDISQLSVMRDGTIREYDYEADFKNNNRSMGTMPPDLLDGTMSPDVSTIVTARRGSDWSYQSVNFDSEDDAIMEDVYGPGVDMPSAWSQQEREYDVGKPVQDQQYQYLLSRWPRSAMGYRRWWERAAASGDLARVVEVRVLRGLKLKIR